MLIKTKPQLTTHASMVGRVCVITGANSGVGFETAKRCAQGGAHVVMVCRSEERGQAAKREVEKVAKGQVDLLCSDLSVMADVRSLAKTLLDKYPRIHVLVNNAGLHSTTRSTTADGFETTFAVNHLAPFLLTLLLLDRLKASAPARIINVSSQGHRFGGLDLNDLNWDKRMYRGLKAYGASKTANMFFTWELADKLRGTGVTVNAVHPGEVKTQIGRDNGKLWHAFHDNVVSRLLKDASLSGEALYYHAASPELANVTGRFFNMTLEEKPHAHAMPRPNRPLAKMVWLLSERLTGLAAPQTTKEAPVAPRASSSRSSKTV